MDAAQERLAQLSRTQQALLAKIQALEEQEKGAPPPLWGEGRTHQRGIRLRDHAPRHASDSDWPARIPPLTWLRRRPHSTRSSPVVLPEEEPRIEEVSPAPVRAPLPHPCRRNTVAVVPMHA